MSLKRLTIVCLCAVMTLVAHAAAQKNEVAGLVGRTFISNQGIKGATFLNNEVRFGNGWTFEVNYAHRVLGAGFASVFLELPAVVNVNEKLNTGLNLIPENFKSYFVTPAARLNVLSDTAISPWVSLGGGYGHFSESSTLVFGGPNPGKTGTSTGILQAGVGLDVRTFDRFSVRGEARDFWSGVPQLNVDTGKSRQHNIFVAVGVVWHF